MENIRQFDLLCRQGVEIKAFPTLVPSGENDQNKELQENIGKDQVIFTRSEIEILIFFISGRFTLFGMMVPAW